MAERVEQAALVVEVVRVPVLDMGVPAHQGKDIRGLRQVLQEVT
jgi:hypothetical protein